MHMVLVRWRIASLFLLLALTGCGERGSGVLKSESRTVASFTGISIGSGIDATVELGELKPVELSGDDNLLALIRSDIEGGTLIIGALPGRTLQPVKPLTAKITIPSLTAITATGAASVTSDGLAPAQLTLTASGASEISLTHLTSDLVKIDASGTSPVTLAGLGKQVEVVMSGTSPVLTVDFPAETVTVNGSGSAHGEVRASVSVSGALSGGSTLKVVGSPTTRSVTVSGGSTVDYP